MCQWRAHVCVSTKCGSEYFLFKWYRQTVDDSVAVVTTNTTLIFMLCILINVDWIDEGIYLYIFSSYLFADVAFAIHCWLQIFRIISFLLFFFSVPGHIIWVSGEAWAVEQWVICNWAACTAFVSFNFSLFMVPQYALYDITDYSIC